MTADALAQARRLRDDAVRILTTGEGDLRQVVRELTEAQAVVSVVAPGTSLHASILGNLARAHEDLGAFGRARQLTCAALAIRRRTEPPGESAAGLLNNLGRIWDQLGNSRRAMARYRQGIATLERVDPSNLILAPLLNNLGLLHAREGDQAGALALYRRAQQLVERVETDTGPTNEVAHCLTSIAAAYQARGDTALALTLAQRALAISRVLAPRAPSTIRRLLQVAGLQHTLGHAAERTALLDEALTLARQVAPGSTYEADAHEALGDALIVAGDLDRAREQHELALDLREQVAPASLSVAASRKALAQVHVMRHEHAAAAAWGTDAVALYRAVAPASDGMVASLLWLATARTALGAFDEAAAAFGEAADLAEVRRTRAPAGESRNHVFAQFQQAYQGLAAVLVLRGGEENAAEAYGQCERARARSLTEQLTERAVALLPQTADQQALLDTEAMLRRRLADLHLAGGPATGGPDQGSIDDQRVALSERLETTERALRAAFPAYGALAYPQPATLLQARAALAPGTLLVQYMMTPAGLIRWVIDHGGFNVDLQDTDADELETLVDQAVAVAGHSRPATGPTDQVLTARVDLSEILLGRIPDHYLARTQRVLICADGPLHHLPFELLAAPALPGRTLVDAYPVSYVPSMTAYRAIDANWSPAGRRPGQEVLVLAPFAHPRPAAVVDLLPALQFTELEAEKIQAGFGAGATVLWDAQATEGRLRAQAPGYRYLHLATHGSFDDADPMYSSLALAPPADGDDADVDDRVQVWEMLRLRLSAELVVCSACDTGRGRLLPGEGLVGMSHALFYAGARSVIVSLWPVNDASTSRIMRTLYAQLRAGRPVAEALQTAKLRERAQREDPYYWAGFVALGMCDVSAPAADQGG